jgi:hypothetical protein
MVSAEIFKEAYKAIKCGWTVKRITQDVEYLLILLFSLRPGGRATLAASP